MDEETTFPPQQQGKALISELRSVVNDYRNRKTVEAREKIIAAMDNTCASLCFGDEGFIRNLNPCSLASALVAVLTSTLATDYPEVQCLAVQALALVADLVPRGGFAVVAARGVQPLLLLLKELDASESTTLEELLRCLTNLAFEAHEQLMQHQAFSVIVSIERRLETHRLRMMCLKCLSHLLTLTSPEEWNIYLSKPCSSLMATFHEAVTRLMKDDCAGDRLSKDDEAYLLRLLECVALTFDRVLCSAKMIDRNSRMVEQLVSSLVVVINGAASMGSRGTALRNAACSPLLTLLFTDPAVTVRIFLKCHVLDSIYSNISGLLEKRPKQASYNGAAVISALMEEDLTAVPSVAEEQKVIPLLEFLLVVMPPSCTASDCDYYTTLPHYIWQWEDDFHNWCDCTEDLSKRLEGEYIKQRRLSGYTVFEVSNATSTLKINFSTMRYRSSESLHYPHNISRRPSIAGYIYRRPIRCQCDVKVTPNSSLPVEVALGRLVSLGAGTTTVLDGEPAVVSAGVPTGNAHSNEQSYCESASYSFGNIAAPSSSNQPSRGHGAHNGGVVEERGSHCCCVSVLRSLFRKLKGSGRSTAVPEAGKYGAGSALTSYEVLDDARVELLRCAATRSNFLQERMIYRIIQQYLPILMRVVDSTANLIIVRHCSVLILRCVDLVIGYFRSGGRDQGQPTRTLWGLFCALGPSLATSLSYLTTSSTTHGSLTLSAAPFREFRCGSAFVLALSALDVTVGTRLPAMNLACETQLTSLSALMMLCSLCPIGVKALTKQQSLALLWKLERITGPTERSSQGGVHLLLEGHRVPPCPFHTKALQIEELRRTLVQQLCSLLWTNARAVDQMLPFKKCCLDISGDDQQDSQLGDSVAMGSPEGSVSPSASCTSLTYISSSGDLDGDTPRSRSTQVIKRLTRINEYMKEHSNDLPVFLYDQPELLKDLASALRSADVREVIGSKMNEVFSQLIKSLLRTICKYTGIGRLEEPRAVERQYSRFQRRTRRNRTMLMVVDYLWTPLRVNLVNTPVQAGKKRSLSKFFRLQKDSTNAADAGSPNAQVRESVLSVLPTTPLSYIAKYIIMRLNEACNNTCDPKSEDAQQQRQQELAEESNFGATLAHQEAADTPVGVNGGVGEETALAGNVISFLNRRESRLSDASDADDEESVTSGDASEFSEGRDGDYLSEHVLSTVSATVSMVPHAPSNICSGPLGGLRASQVEGSTSTTITIDNVVFFCGGKPVTDLSISVLDLCGSSYCQASGWSDLHQSDSDENCGDNAPVRHTSGERLHYLMKNVLSLWSSVHTINYSIVGMRANEERRGTDGEEVLDMNENSPVEVFSRLSYSPRGTPFLWAAADLLNEMGQLVRAAGGALSMDDPLVSSALFHEFYNHFGVLMLPALAYGIIHAYLADQQDRYLISSVLWKYPQTFSYEIRRTLLHLLLSVRRIHTPAIVKLKEWASGSSPIPPVQGLEWLRPDLNMRGTYRVRVQRFNIFESGARVLRRHAMCPLTLSVEFENELGVGAGPAVEFYNLLAKKFQDVQLHMWRTEEFTDESAKTARRVQLPLFPSLFQDDESLSNFELLGMLVGRVLMEERVVDLPLSECFLRGILGDLDDTNRLPYIDPQLDKQLDSLLKLTANELEECELMFVIQHGDAEHNGGIVELCPNGATTQVSAMNVNEYVQEVRRYYSKTALARPVSHFIQGLRYTLIPYHLRLFDARELQLVISGPEGKIWESAGDLLTVITTNHGYDKNSLVVAYFVEVVSSWDVSLQRSFLRFVTGSTRIPIGGLRPPITVVRRSVEVAPGEATNQLDTTNNFLMDDRVEVLQNLMDASLPTVNTCAHYLKLPNYSSKKILEERLKLAITEGQGTFSLT